VTLFFDSTTKLLYWESHVGDSGNIIPGPR